MNKENYDLNGNGKIDPDEREIMLEDRRRRMEDQDAKRDTQRRLTVACTAGMLLYPLVIVLAVWVGLDQLAFPTNQALHHDPLIQRHLNAQNNL